MHEIARQENSIKIFDTTKSASSQIMQLCRIITPYFYKNQSRADMEAERIAIDLLTDCIEPEVLAKMCIMAVNGYAKSRSEDTKTFFDINYILTFYDKAKNAINLDGYDPFLKTVEEIECIEI